MEFQAQVRVPGYSPHVPEYDGQNENNSRYAKYLRNPEEPLEGALARSRSSYFVHGVAEGEESRIDCI